MMFNEDMLEHVVEWVRDNYKVDEVFDDDAITEWAEENDYIHEDDVDYEVWAIENGYVLLDDLTPGEAFDEDDLAQWAEDNGYILEEDCPDCDCDD